MNRCGMVHIGVHISVKIQSEKDGLEVDRSHDESTFEGFLHKKKTKKKATQQFRKWAPERRSRRESRHLNQADPAYSATLREGKQPSLKC
jgi:hypothetical protein